jgi:hypothetical protein
MLSLELIIGAVPVVMMVSPHVFLTQAPPVRESFLSVKGTHTSSLFWFDEICRSVLTASSFTFVAANAPAPVVSSFGAQQQRLARLSLQTASAILVERLSAEALALDGLSQTLRSYPRKLRDLSLLGVCATGRMGLGLLRGVNVGIFPRLQIWISKSILSKMYSLMMRGEHRDRVFRDTQHATLSTSSTALSGGRASLGAIEEDIMRALGASFPNELSSLIFLSTLRDNNSGHYFHPELSTRFSEKLADEALVACHRQMYERVVALPIEQLTDDLDAYMKTVPAPRHRLIDTWVKLRAYRATIPLDADPISVEIYFAKIEVAIAILAAGLRHRSRHQAG